MAIILMQALIPQYDNGRQAFMEPSGNQARLDVSLTQNIHTDRARRALAAALIRFSEETGSKIIAEGVETISQLKVLRELGVTKAQGYLLGRPMPLASASELCSAHGKRRL